jgi:hypothetical protein
MFWSFIFHYKKVINYVEYFRFETSKQCIVRNIFALNGFELLRDIPGVHSSLDSEIYFFKLRYDGRLGENYRKNRENALFKHPKVNFFCLFSFILISQ